MRDSLNGLTMADDSLLLYDTYSVVRYLHRFQLICLCWLLQKQVYMEGEIESPGDGLFPWKVVNKFHAFVVIRKSVGLEFMLPAVEIYEDILGTLHTKTRKVQS